MDQETNQQNAATNPPQTASPPVQPPEKVTIKKKTGLIIGIVIAALILIGAIVAIFFLFSPKKVVVGESEHPYIYACGTLQREDILKTFDYIDDKNRETIAETRPFVPGGATKNLDALAALSDEDEKNESGERYVQANCWWTFAREGEDDKPIETQLTLAINQYAEEEGAKNELKELQKKYQSKEGAITLPAFSENSLVTHSETEDRTGTRINAYVQHKNSLFWLYTTVGKDKKAEQYKDNLDGMFSKITDVSSDSPGDISGFTEFGGSTFVDVCSATDPSKIISELEGASAEPQVEASNDYGKEPEKSSKDKRQVIASSCSLNFNYTDDDEARTKAQEKLKEEADNKSDPSQNPFGLKKQTELSLAQRYPDKVALVVQTFENADTAKTVYEGYRKQENQAPEPKPGTQAPKTEENKQDFEGLGDAAFRQYTKITTPAVEGKTIDFSGSPLKLKGTPEQTRTAKTVMMLQGNRFILLSIIQADEGEPYPATIKGISDDTIKQLAEYLLDRVVK